MRINVQLFNRLTIADQLLYLRPRSTEAWRYDTFEHRPFVGKS